MKKFLLILAAVFCCTLGVNAQETPDYFCISIDSTSSQFGVQLILLKKGKTEFIVTPKVEYKINDGGWTNWEDKAFSVKLNDKVYFRAGENGVPTTNATFSESTESYMCLYTNSVSGFSASGNIMSLLDGEDFEDLTTVPANAFMKLFAYQTTSDKAKQNKLTNIENLRMPATTLGGRCYYEMFFYNQMLENVPSDLLPATTLADSCYYEMFKYCTAITDAPMLPATTLKKYCYSNMFDGCTSLRSVEVNFSSWPTAKFSTNPPEDYRGTYYWLRGVAPKGELTCPEDLRDEVDDDYNSKKPSGWTVSHPTNYIIINDNEAYTSTKDKTATVTYNRTFDAANLWEPLYVPFSINITADLLSKCDIADIYMVSKGSGVYSGKDVTVVRKMSAEETTIAHTPYFIRAKASGDFTFTQENTLVKAAPQTPSIIDCSTTKDKYEFIGSYAGETLDPAEGDFYILDAEGALTKISEETTLPFNRWYMQKTSRQIQPIGANLAPSMPILTIGEDDTTGIIGLDEVKTNANDKLYNMMGVAVEAGRTSLPAGVYLQHGKKFIVK